ncbi:MAG: hypothetical protein JRZ94_06020 [Nitrososphaerota archaeon]|nr:hypothetical protein [Nitrososphaerota archaeon]
MTKTATILKLQNLILEYERAQAGHGKRSIEDIRIEGNGYDLLEGIPSEIDADVYYTLARAIKDRILDPNEVLAVGVKQYIEQEGDFFKLAGLALKLDASPDLYVLVEDPEQNDIVLHIFYYLFILVVNADDQTQRPGLESRMLELVALLSVAGGKLDMPVTDANILLERRRRMNANSSQAQAYSDAGRYKSLTVLQMLENDDDQVFAEQVYQTYVFYRKNRLNLTKLIAEENELALDIGLILDLDNVLTAFMIEGEEESETLVPKLNECIQAHSNKLVQDSLKKIMKIDKQGRSLAFVTIEEAEQAFLTAANSYNIPVVILLLKAGVKPRYDHITRIILKAERKLREGLPASCAALNRILVEMEERGMGIDEEQLRLIYIYSPATFNELKKLQNIPYWKRTCSVPGNFIRPDLQRMARELNLPPDLDKIAICREFHNMDQTDAKTLETVAHKLQGKRITASNTTIGDIVAGTRQSSSREDSERAARAVCVNANLLSRNPTDYADIDLLLIDEGEDTYCFESRDYATLLEPAVPVNPITGNKLPEKTVGEIQARLRSLNRNGLPIESVGITEALKQLKMPTQKDKYEEFVRGKVEEFVDIAAEYGISRELFFETPDNGGIPNQDMEQITQTLLEDKGIMFNIDNRSASLRSMAMAVMEKVDDIRNMERLEDESPEDFEAAKTQQIDDLFTELANLIGVPK